MAKDLNVCEQMKAQTLKFLPVLPRLLQHKNIDYSPVCAKVYTKNPNK
jgi:hypothetical protein